jgi:hypothetical protein
LAVSSRVSPQIFLAIGPTLVDEHFAKELVALGAIAWHLADDPLETLNSLAGLPAAAPATFVPAAPPIPRAKILTHIPESDWPYLTHCTRSSGGPWPDESEAEFVAKLLTELDTPERTPLSALSRIIQQRRLIASGRGIRNNSRVVCWTRLPLSTLLQRRVYRSHRVRWDFEPYGICILRNWLAQRGARPVIYGDQSDWEGLGENDRPFFQARFSHGRNSRHTYDWTTEQEWRIAGDLALDQLPAEAGFVFVPTFEEANRLADFSPWPIVVLAANE